MQLVDFERIVLTWHDFFLAIASGAAALLGLLFVAMSLNLDDISHVDRPDLRVLADQAFSNFLFALVVALFFLVPAPYSNTVSAERMLIGVAAVGLYRIGRRARRALRQSRLAWGPIHIVRRLGAPAAADGCLIVAAALLAASDQGAFYWVLAATLVFLLSAADSSWDLLVRVGAERQLRRADAASTAPANGAPANQDTGPTFDSA